MFIDFKKQLSGNVEFVASIKYNKINPDCQSWLDNNILMSLSDERKGRWGCHVPTRRYPRSIRRYRYSSRRRQGTRINIIKDGSLGIDRISGHFISGIGTNIIFSTRPGRFSVSERNTDHNLVGIPIFYYVSGIRSDIKISIRLGR